MKRFRIGQIVPSSNTTMELEVPALLNARRVEPEEDEVRFSYHSSRMRMMHVNTEELRRMDADSTRCAVELSDARVDVMAYACLVAIMSQGRGYHLAAQERLAKAAAENGALTPVLSSAGALVDALAETGMRRVAIITPYMRPLTRLVADYIEATGVEVVDAISLEVADNLAVGRLDPMNLVEHADRLQIGQADAVVLSCCVQMPSLPAVQPVEDRLGRPVLTASIATARGILRTLELSTHVPDAGYLLSGKF